MKEGITIDKIKEILSKLPHSEGRVPYTYHHDFLRRNTSRFIGTSRSQVASQHQESEIELYAVSLSEILTWEKWYDIIDLIAEYKEELKEVSMMTNQVLYRYNY